MTRIACCFAVSALLAGVGWSLFAQDAAAPPSRGKVLLLRNERTFEGDVEKVGDAYRVRKGAGEIVVPANQVLRLCADWDDALNFMRSRANLGDPDERLRLAKWCHLNHQIARARGEAKVALEMRPKHLETKRLVKLLELTPTGNAAKPPPDKDLVPVPQLDLSFETVTAFNLRIQPVLMNTCIQCHGGAYSGKFRLYRLHEGGERVATQRNLAAVIAQVHLTKPAASPLLFMAVSAHSNAKTSPLPGRQAPSFLMLQAWIEQMIADNPHLLEKTVAAPTVLGPARLPAAVTKARPVVPPALPPLPGVQAAQYAPAPGGAVPAVPRPVLPAAAAVAAPDEFDPRDFNRQMHPDRK